MDLSLQFGYGMMDHSRNLLQEWGGGTVILSPRDLKEDQLRRFGREISQMQGGEVLLDPQFYLPHADHARLTGHTYWPDSYETSSFWTGPELAGLLDALHSLNREIGTSAFILPGLFAPRVDDDWLSLQSQVMEEVAAVNVDGRPLYATVALGAEALGREDDVHAILDSVAGWGVTGVYLVGEHPKGEYLVTDPNWLANLADLVAGLRLKGIRALVGYANHQMLVLAAAGANALASGTWLNVRSFPPDKFRAPYEEEVRQRATWVYCPPALSEYKLPFLDIARRSGLLSAMMPPEECTSAEVGVLFSGQQPTTVGLTEQAAFRHYLRCFREQVTSARRDTFAATVQAHERALDEAERLLHDLHREGVRGQMRDFAEAVDANRAALASLTRDRGPMLSRAWSSL